MRSVADISAQRAESPFQFQTTEIKINLPCDTSVAPNIELDSLVVGIDLGTTSTYDSRSSPQIFGLSSPVRRENFNATTLVIYYLE